MADIARYIPLGGLGLALLLLWGWRRRRRAAPPALVVPEGRCTYEEVLDLFTAPVGDGSARSVLAQEIVGGVAIEFVGEELSHLLVAFPEGTMSLYLRGGPSMHALALPDEGMDPGADLRLSVAAHLAHLQPDTDTRLPDAACGVIRTRTGQGCLAVRVPLDEVGSHPCSETLRIAAALQKDWLATAR